MVGGSGADDGAPPLRRGEDGGGGSGSGDSNDGIIYPESASDEEGPGGAAGGSGAGGAAAARAGAGPAGDSSSGGGGGGGSRVSLPVAPVGELDSPTSPPSLTSFSRARRGVRLSPVFRDAWVFSASRALATVLAPAIPTNAAALSISAQLPSARERHTARLIAGFHVHALKAFAALAHHALPGALWATSAADGPVNEAAAVAARAASDPTLRGSLASPAAATELFADMAYAAATLYEMGGRPRGAAALDGDAGAMRLRNGNLVEAERLLSAQCSRFFADHGWDQLHQRRRVELGSAEKGSPA